MFHSFICLNVCDVTGYAMKDSIEREYKPKRGRVDHGGGGRTAIPYIRHRGDIYERE